MTVCILCNTEKEPSEFYKMYQFRTRCRKCLIERNKKGCERLRLKALRQYSGGDPKCSCCGITELHFLTFDHETNIGKFTKNGKRRLTGIHLVRWLLKKHRPGITVQCYNCNCAKGFYGVCPHKELPK